MKKTIKKLVPFIEGLFIPFTIFSAYFFKVYRRMGVKRMKINTSILKAVGVFPIIDHYYEPLFNHRLLSKKLSQPRPLPGMDFKLEKQLNLLKKLKYQREFDKFIQNNTEDKTENNFKLNNGSFESGDAEFLFNFLMHIRPSKVIEIGCGSSTKVISHALSLNKKNWSAESTHICIEPYEQKWLDDYKNVKVFREKIENMKLDIFANLTENDLLFVDSSHMVRPQGDVLHIFQQIIPQLKKNVFVHIHDIFSPRDYPSAMIKEDVRFWNEQYILEVMLSNNNDFEIVAALNYLKHERFEALSSVCPYLTPDREPGSFYFKC